MTGLVSETGRLPAEPDAPVLARLSMLDRFLPVRLVAGFLTRTLGERRRGRAWYEQTFLPRISPIALYGCCSPW